MLDKLLQPEVVFLYAVVLGIAPMLKSEWKIAFPKKVRPEKPVSIEESRLEKITTAYVNNGLSHLELEQSIEHVLKGGALDGHAKPARTKLATQAGMQHTSNAIEQRSPFPEPQMEHIAKMMHGGFGVDGPVVRDQFAKITMRKSW